MGSLLFVCLGNICRSPMAEAIAKHRAPDWHIDSAGTSSTHAGEPADPRTRAVLRRHGIPYSGRSRQAVAADGERFDRILVMDASNERNLRRILPAHTHARIHRVLEPLGAGLDVADPYYGGPDGFDQCFAQLSEALEHWLASESRA